MVVVYDTESDMQRTDVIVELGRDLSTQLDCPILAVLNHEEETRFPQEKPGSESFGRVPEVKGLRLRHEPTARR